MRKSTLAGIGVLSCMLVAMAPSARAQVANAAPSAQLQPAADESGS